MIRKLHEGESYGWVVDESDAFDAYNFACEYFGKENLDEQIVECLSADELSDCLAFIFRMNEFREWDNYKNGYEDDEDDDDDDDFDESVKRNTSLRRIKRVNEDTYSLDAKYDSRKSFYGKAKIDIPNNRCKILKSYDTPVCAICDDEVVLFPKWSESSTTLRHVKEFLLQMDLKQQQKRRFQIHMMLLMLKTL